MTYEEISNQLIKDVESAISKVTSIDNSIRIKKEDNGSDTVDNYTLILTSKKWPTGSKVKFSMNEYSEYLGDPDDPSYFTRCDMGVLFDKIGMYGFAGSMHSYSVLRKKKMQDVGNFIAKVFLPTAIEILKFMKKNSVKVSIKEYRNLREFFRNMWNGTVKNVPSEDQISNLFR